MHMHGIYGVASMIGSLKLLVSFAKEPYKRDYILGEYIVCSCASHHLYYSHESTRLGECIHSPSLVDS